MDCKRLSSSDFRSALGICATSGDPECLTDSELNAILASPFPDDTGVTFDTVVRALVCDIRLGATVSSDPLRAIHDNWGVIIKLKFYTDLSQSAVLDVLASTSPVFGWLVAFYGIADAIETVNAISQAIAVTNYAPRARDLYLAITPDTWQNHDAEATFWSDDTIGPERYAKAACGCGLKTPLTGCNETRRACVERFHTFLRDALYPSFRAYLDSIGPNVLTMRIRTAMIDYKHAAHLTGNAQLQLDTKRTNNDRAKYDGFWRVFTVPLDLLRNGFNFLLETNVSTSPSPLLAAVVPPNQFHSNRDGSHLSFVASVDGTSRGKVVLKADRMDPHTYKLAIKANRLQLAGATRDSRVTVESGELQGVQDLSASISGRCERYVALSNGDPGVPGDGVVVDGYPTASENTFEFASPVILRTIRKGMVLAVFPSVPDEHPLPFYVMGGGVFHTHSYFGIEQPRITPLLVNGVRGYSLDMTRSWFERAFGEPGILELQGATLIGIALAGVQRSSSLDAVAVCAKVDTVDDVDRDGYCAENSPCPGCDSRKCTRGFGDCEDGHTTANPAAVEGPSAEGTCNDGLDNDCDGATDCNDQNCSEVASCGSTGHVTFDVPGIANLYQDTNPETVSFLSTAPVRIPGGGICPGQPISLSATGCVVDEAARCTGPDGPPDLPFPETYLGLRTYALIGRWSKAPNILDSTTAIGSPFVVGSSTTRVAPCSTGRCYLFLGENDGVFDDNSGAYSVTATWTPETQCPG
ncbi:MAG TPA: hypothetical protein VFA43_11830 [Gemmatimonadaceae bacterium]|nr:hypothetical protein [Gemmatimonadaceae bacterium]